MNNQEMKEKIIHAAIKVFNRKGPKFTMDDIAAELSISKKTIYTVFRDKESMFSQMVDQCFDKIRDSKDAVLNDPNLSTVEKIRKIMGVMPESYVDVDFGQLYQLKDKYFRIYQKMEMRIETGWESTMELLKRGMEEGVVRPMNTVVFKTMMEATLEQFLQRDVLAANGICYKDALDEVVNILLDGILVSQSIG